MSDKQAILEARVGFLVPLNKLPSDRQTRLLEDSEVLKLRKKQTLFKQGERDDYTYYVLDGEIEMYADDSLIKAVTGGDGASFQPLAQLQPRQMTAIAKKTAEILRVNRSLLEQLLSMDDAGVEADNGTGVEVEEMESTQSGDWLMTLLQSELFTRIPPTNIQGLLDTLETVSVEPGEAVITQGEPGDFYYAIQSGTCEVVRSGANDREIKLAELQAGDTFGEEALISGGKRNATVRMTSAGELARLTKDDFTRLIKVPMVNSASLADATAKVAAGAVWLDVRFEDEHSHNGLPGSRNIPLSSLRSRMDELDPATEFVAYCDTGGRSSAAAFLLAEKGYAACYVDGGAVTEPVPEKPKSAPATTPKAKAKEKPQEQVKPAPTEINNDAVLEANARAASLSAELEIARLTIEKAEKMMADAETMKREADRIVSEKLAAERAQISDQSEKLGAKLAEAQRLRESLTAQQKTAEKEVARCNHEVEQRLTKLEQDAQDRLIEREKGLEALYQKQAEQLESTQTDRETELRKKLGKELSAERTKFEQEFLRTTEELERAKEERRQAIAAKEAATAEAQSTIAEFRAQQQALLDEQQATFALERQRLEGEAARIQKMHDEATAARGTAEAAKVAAENELKDTRARLAATPQPNDDLVIHEIEQRASAADRDLEQAIETESIVATAARENEDELERTHDTASGINLLMEKELNEWVGEQHDLQESTLQRVVLSRQKEMVERIKARAAEMKSNTETTNKSLLDEIQQQLAKD